MMGKLRATQELQENGIEEREIKLQSLNGKKKTQELKKQ